MTRVLRIDRWILDPLWVIPIGFGLQVLVWHLWMPVEPTIEGAAGRFSSPQAMYRFAVLCLLVVFGIVLGRWAIRSLVPRVARAPAVPELLPTIRALRRLAFWTLMLALAGEVVYVRVLFAHPQVFADALAGADFAAIGDFVKAQRIVGLSSLNNLFVVSTGIYAMLAFSPHLDRRRRRRAGRRLLLLGAAVLVHALLLAARMFFIYYLLIVLAAYLLADPQRSRRAGRYIWRAMALLLGLIWIGELARGGWNYAHTKDVSVFSGDVQAHVASRLVEGYIGADFNNAMLILDAAPSLQWVSTSDVFRTVGLKLGFEYESYEALPRWSSRFATVNVLALWWFDMGWASALAALLIGAWLGGTHALALRGRGRLRGSTLLFLISYPGILSLTRINYFGLTIFVLPCLLLLGWLALRELARGERRRIVESRRQNTPGASLLPPAPFAG